LCTAEIQVLTLVLSAKSLSPEKHKKFEIYLREENLSQ
jgi:hypothetical protein